MTSAAKILCIALFLVAVTLPGLVMLTVDPADVSMTERRKLAPRPALPHDWRSLAALPAEIDAYVDDHFGFRRDLIHWFNRIRVTWFGVSTSSIVLVGSDGWLYQTGNPHLQDMRNALPFSDRALRRWADVLSAKHDWLSARGIDYLFVFAPNKHLAYPEHLPGSVKRVSERSRLDQLVDYLQRNTDVPVLDLRPALHQGRAVQRTYHKTDTHWNDFGAYVAYRAILDRLATPFEDLRRVDLAPEDFETRDTAGGDLAQALEMQDVLREQSISTARDIEQCAHYPDFSTKPDIDTKHREPFHTVCPQARYRVLMFRDSYALALMPFLSESFAYVHYVPNSPSNRRQLHELVAEHGPELVIEQRASRWLRTPEG